MLCEAPVVRNQYGGSSGVTRVRSVTTSRLSYVERIHFTTIGICMCIWEQVTKVRYAVWKCIQRDRLYLPLDLDQSRRRSIDAGRSIRAGERAEIIIKGAVLLDDENNVLDRGRDGTRTGVRWGSWSWQDKAYTGKK